MDSVFNPAWRTQTVVQLCQAIRETGDYGSTPILADALQDADCDDEVLLIRLRDFPGCSITNERLVATILSEETEKAVKWMNEFVAEFGPESYDYENDEDE